MAIARMRSTSINPWSKYLNFVYSSSGQKVTAGGSDGIIWEEIDYRPLEVDLDFTKDKTVTVITAAVRCAPGFQTEGPTVLSFEQTSSGKFSLSLSQDGPFTSSIKITDSITCANVIFYVKAEALQNVKAYITTSLQVDTKIIAAAWLDAYWKGSYFYSNKDTRHQLDKYDFKGNVNLINIGKSKYGSSDYTSNNSSLTGIKSDDSTMVDSFSGNVNLTTFLMPNLVSTGQNFLLNSKQLITVNLENLKSLGKLSLTCCPQIEKLSLSHLETAAEECLGFCDNLTEIDLSSLKSAKHGFLCECHKLKKIIINNETPPTIETGTDTFRDLSSDCNLYVPSSALDAYKNDTVWGTQFKNRILLINEKEI